MFSVQRREKEDKKKCIWYWGYDDKSDNVDKKRSKNANVSFYLSLIHI